MYVQLPRSEDLNPSYQLEISCNSRRVMRGQKDRQKTGKQKYLNKIVLACTLIKCMYILEKELTSRFDPVEVLLYYNYKLM